MAMVENATMTANATDLANTPFGKAWQEATGVELEIMQLADVDALNLLYASGELPDLIYSCGQRAKRACLHAHLATAAGVNTPQLCCVASLMPRQLAAGVLTLHSGKVLPLRILL